jgi:hypothetical protein
MYVWYLPIVNLLFVGTFISAKHYITLHKIWKTFSSILIFHDPIGSVSSGSLFDFRIKYFV